MGRFPCGRQVHPFPALADSGNRVGIGDRCSEDLFLVPEETFRSRISPYVSNEVHLGLWYLALDGSDVHASDVPSLLDQITAVQQRAGALRPNTELDMSVVEALEKYQRAAEVLTVLLYAFSTPIVGLLLVFVGLVVGLSVGRRRNEIAVLRSRGATASQVVGIATLEGLLLGAVALAVGTPAGTVITRFIGKARTFLSFTLQPNLRVGVTLATLCFGVAAVGLTLIAQVLPTIGATRYTIVTFKRSHPLGPQPYGHAALAGISHLSQPSGFDKTCVFLLAPECVRILPCLSIR